MSTFKIHDLESAPEGSKPLLENSLKGFGMIPNLHGVLAESPQLLEAYQNLHKWFTETSFDAEELTVVWQTINVEHACHYCVPAHTAIAHMMKVDAGITESLRNSTPLSSTKLQTLKDLTLSLVRNRGHVSQEELDAFFAVGYSQQQVLEVVLAIAQKTVSNYTNHLAKTPVDAPFQDFVWEKA